ncbi:hypothetical protein Cba03nite_66580 [Catellatospora bangladeshensis]|uniref:Uncharacterized protein n=1 Tax=Catellatospora bangladeshensis TaxID=310355 RepID=A0A8J3JX57_9ACTN|nr:hypothetical protein Cba03nite_66580 [Catellatospora bangladeshensis]
MTAGMPNVNTRPNGTRAHQYCMRATLTGRRLSREPLSCGSVGKLMRFRRHRARKGT